MVGIDVRNLYENGGMVHCVTQQHPEVPLKLTCARVANDTITLTFNGDTLHSYTLQATTDLQSSSWADLENFTLSGQVKTFDEPLSGYNRRFFRVVTP